MSLSIHIEKVQYQDGVVVISAQVHMPTLHPDSIPPEDLQVRQRDHDARITAYLNLHLGSATLAQEPVEPPTL